MSLGISPFLHPLPFILTNLLFHCLRKRFIDADRVEGAAQCQQVKHLVCLFVYLKCKSVYDNNISSKNKNLKNKPLPCPSYIDWSAAKRCSSFSVCRSRCWRMYRWLPGNVASSCTRILRNNMLWFDIPELLNRRCSVKTNENNQQDNRKHNSGISWPEVTAAIKYQLIEDIGWGRTIKSFPFSKENNIIFVNPLSECNGPAINLIIAKFDDYGFSDQILTVEIRSPVSSSVGTAPYDVIVMVRPTHTNVQVSNSAHDQIVLLLRQCTWSGTYSFRNINVLEDGKGLMIVSKQAVQPEEADKTKVSEHLVKSASPEHICRKNIKTHVYHRMLGSLQPNELPKCSPHLKQR